MASKKDYETIARPRIDINARAAHLAMVEAQEELIKLTIVALEAINVDPTGPTVLGNIAQGCANIIRLA